jgi:hypothetical protein
LSSRELMDVFDAAEVRVSAGSACSSSKAAPSYVLDAMGVPLWRSAGAIRMSFGPLADDATIAAACERIERCGAALRASCLIPSERSAAPQDGLLQLGVEGVQLDGAGRRQPQLHRHRSAAGPCGAHRVLRALPELPGASHRQYLAECRPRHADRRAGPPLQPPPEADEYGWPLAAASIALDNGASATPLRWVNKCWPACVRHRRRVARLSAGHGASGAAGCRGALCLQRPSGPAGLRSVTGEQTLLCPTRDEANQFCTIAAPVASIAADAQLDRTALDAFLQAHPDACLVDVREPMNSPPPWRQRRPAAPPSACR